MRPRRNFATAARWLLRFVIGVAIVWFLASRHDNTALLKALRATSWPVLLFSVAFYWCGQVLSAWKWKLLLQAQNANVSLFACCRLYAVGMFWNLWMPTNIGGDAVRALRCGALCGSRAVAISSILVERLTGLAALIVLGAGAFVWQIAQAPLPTNDLTRRLATLFGIALIAVCAVFYFLSRAQHPKSDGELKGWRKKIAGLRLSLQFYMEPRRRGVLMMALLLSLVFQCSQILLNIALARSLGLEVSAVVFCWVVPALALASLVPLGIGGLGVREIAAVSMLGALGAPAPLVIAWSLLWQATVWISSLPGAIELLPRD